MDRRLALAVVGGAVLALAGCATSASEGPVRERDGGAPVEGLRAGVIADLQQLPRSANGLYVLLIPTDARVQATPALMEGLEHVRSALAQRSASRPVVARLVGDPASGGFDAACTAAAFSDLGLRQDLVAPSRGAVLVILCGPPTASSPMSVYNFEGDDPSSIADALRATRLDRRGPVMPADPHFIPDWLRELLHLPRFTPAPPSGP